MRYRLLGRTGLRISELFFGTLAFGEPDGGPPLDECRRMLDMYADAGGNVVDTASSYGGGQSETMVGELLRGRRDRFVVATKYTWTRDPRDPNAAGNHRKNLTHSLEASLRRLGTDHVDLYWVHVWDRHTPIEETMRALDDAVRAGKVLYVGLSDAPAWVAARANALADWHGWTPFAGMQVPYNLLNRDVEREVLPMAEALGLTVATWGPLAHGVLSGAYTRPAGAEPEPEPEPEVEAESEAGDGAAAPPALGDQERAAARAVQDVADELGATPAQVAIAWTRARWRAVHPIVGPLTAVQLKESLGAVDVTLPEEALGRLDAVTGFTPGFPEGFIAEATPWVFGEVSSLVDGR